MSLAARIAGGRPGWNRSSGGHGTLRESVFAASAAAPGIRSGLAQLTCQERWLSFAEFIVLLLTAAGFVTATWPHSLRDYDPLFHIRPAEAIVGLLGLLLLFQAHATHPRGCDFAPRLAGDVLLAVLWDCPVGSVQRVLERVSPLVFNCDGKEIPVACSAAWVDYQASEAPGELITRAEHMLQLYNKADQESGGPILTAC